VQEVQKKHREEEQQPAVVEPSQEVQEKNQEQEQQPAVEKPSHFISQSSHHHTAQPQKKHTHHSKKAHVKKEHNSINEADAELKREFKFDDDTKMITKQIIQKKDKFEDDPTGDKYVKKRTLAKKNRSTFEKISDEK
jgi:hypothetical protein